MDFFHVNLIMPFIGIRHIRFTQCTTHLFVHIDCPNIYDTISEFCVILLYHDLQQIQKNMKARTSFGISDFARTAKRLTLLYQTTMAQLIVHTHLIIYLQW